MYSGWQDLDSDNILINWIGGRSQTAAAINDWRTDPFRSFFSDSLLPQ
jgi:hypothetical protein